MSGERPDDDLLEDLARQLPEAEPDASTSAALRRTLLFRIGQARRRRVLAWRVAALAACALAGLLAAVVMEARRNGPSEAPTRIAAAPGVTRVEQREGRATYDVAPRRAGERFVVVTPDAEVEVRGTRFTVSIDPGATAVEVQHGRVEVRDRAGVLRHVLHGGERGRVAHPTDPGVPHPTRRGVAVREPSRLTPAPSPASDRASPIAEPARPPRPAPGRPDDAELRLFRSAHELHFARGDFAAAVEGWDRYLAAYPRGSLAQEARYNRAVCMLRLGRTSEAEADLSAISARPDGFRAREAQLLRGAALRLEGRCAEAEAALQPLRAGADELARRAAALPPCRPSP